MFGKKNLRKRRESEDKKTQERLAKNYTKTAVQCRKARLHMPYASD